MLNQPLVSVIIPVYNVEKYLNECVESVINQTYKNLEILLIDDGSTDNSGEICDEYKEKDSRINVIHKKNDGLSNARNDGINNSNGEYLYFLDSDDYLEHNAIYILLNIIIKNNSDFVFFDGVSFDDLNGNYSFNCKQNYIRKKQYPDNNGINVLELMQKNKEYHSAVPLMFFKKSFLSENQLCFKSDILHEDMLFTYQAYIKAGLVSQCENALYNRRNRSNSITTSAKNLKHFNGMQSVFYEIIQFSENNGVIKESVAESYISRCAFNVFNIYEKLKNKDKKVCKEDFYKFKNYVIKYNAFKDKTLLMRCKGKLFWLIYKFVEKLFN